MSVHPSAPLDHTTPLCRLPGLTSPTPPLISCYPSRRETPKSDPRRVLDCYGSNKPFNVPLIVDHFPVCLSLILLLVTVSFLQRASCHPGFLFLVSPVTFFTIVPSTSLSSRRKLYCRYYVPIFYPLSRSSETTQPHRAYAPQSTQHIYHLMYLPYVASQPK